MIVGYKLVDENGIDIQQWGGIYGQCPSIPNFIILPNGDHVHAPSLNESYGKYKLVEWHISDSKTQVPNSVSAKQIRLLLLKKNLLVDVETMIKSQDQATQITWEFASEFLRTDLLLVQLVQYLNLTDKEFDDFLIEANNL